MKSLFFLITTLCLCLPAFSAGTGDSLKPAAPDKPALKFNLNADGSHYIQATFMNQTWVRYNENNPGSTLFSHAAPTSFDIGLRRTRIQLLGQISDRVFLYFQFGQNNFNNTAGYNVNGGNRKIAAFFHDAVCEYRITKGNQLKVGGGLTILNGLSRFSQPSVGSIMTLDVPVFLQYTVDQTDQFNRRLAIYARGQLGRFDYRAYVSNPFPVSSNGVNSPGIGRNASFVNTSALPNGSGPGIRNQYGSYLSYNLLENEPHITPYMQGTYLGNRRIWNIGTGLVYQDAATWNLSPDEQGLYRDTSYNRMLLLSLETFLDLPLNKDKHTMLSAFAGYYSTGYGARYLRYNGIMNPATGSTAGNLMQAGAYGNAFPMFGTGQVGYAQIGFLLPRQLLGEKNGQLMPYLSGQYASYEALQHKGMLVFDLGLNWFMHGHQSKISLDYQNRPTYTLGSDAGVREGPHKSSLVMQYQVLF